MDQATVLIIDDSAADRAFTQRLLKAAPEIASVHTAGSWQEGHKLFEANAIDCVLLDYSLPEQDGLALLPELRAGHEQCPVIMLTGYGSEEVAVAAMKEGAADYLAKETLTADNLRRAISNAIERATLQARLLTLDQHHRLVLENAQNGIIALDAHRNVLLINPAARALLRSTDEHTPFAWPAHVQFFETEHIRPLEGSENPVDRALAGEQLDGEINFIACGAEAAQRYVRLSSSFVTDPHSSIRTVIILDDVTEQEVNRQQIERIGRLEALGQLTGGISHDINNLLATILYATELVSDEQQTETARQLLSTIKSSIERGTTLTRQLLAFATQQPGRKNRRTIQTVLDDLRTMAGGAISERIALEVDLEDPELSVVCDQGLLDSALLNLTLNSRDAILQSGVGDRIKIVARNIDGPPAAPASSASRITDHLACIEISVSDNGPGMSEEVKRRATDPFFSTKDMDRGSGLGLTMVYSFVAQAGGHLDIASEEGKGTTIRIQLPAPQEHATDVPEATTSPQRGQGETILVVDDEQELLSGMSAVLRSLGYKTLGAQGGHKALEIVESGAAFDLLLTDVVMSGGIGGFELAEQLRKTHPDLPVVYTTGYSGVSGRQIQSGNAALFKKPGSRAELAQVIRKSLDHIVV